MAHRVGGLMSYWVLTANSTVIARTTVQRVTSLEMQQGHMKERTLAFDEAIRDKIKDSDHIILEGGKTQPHDWTDHPFEDDPDFVEEFRCAVSDNEVKDADEAICPGCLRHIPQYGTGHPTRGQLGAKIGQGYETFERRQWFAYWIS